MSLRTTSTEVHRRLAMARPNRSSSTGRSTPARQYTPVIAAGRLPAVEAGVGQGGVDGRVEGVHCIIEPGELVIGATTPSRSHDVTVAGYQPHIGL